MLKHKLFLIDALAIIYRSYYAFIRTPRMTSKGINASAIYGFIITLEDLLKKENPSHIAVVFDAPGRTFRHDEFSEYKAQRMATPEDIRISIPIIKEVIEAYNIPVMEMVGYEADDIIGTVAKNVDKSLFDVYMMTPDKDYVQLVDDNIFIYKPKYGKNDFDLIDAKRAKEKYSLNHTSQMIDMLGLMGDSSDNIPGCPGIGEKTAYKLLSKYESIDNLLKNLESVEPRLKRKIEDNVDKILLSRSLATIKTDVPIEVNVKKFIRKPANEQRLRELFSELEFKTLLARMPSSKLELNQPMQRSFYGDLFAQVQEIETEGSKQGTIIATGTNEMHSINNTPHTYRLITSEEDMERLCKRLCKEISVCFDTETTSTSQLTYELVGIAFSYAEGEAFYVAIEDSLEAVHRALDIFRPFFENEHIEKVGQNIKFDILVLNKFGVTVKGPLFDTMIAHYLINPELQHGLDYMAEACLQYKTIKFEELIGKKTSSRKENLKEAIRRVPLEDLCSYAAEDADITLRLKNFLRPQLKEREQLDLFYSVELPLIYVLVEMESTGVRIDLDTMEKLSKEYSQIMLNTEKEVYDSAGVIFNLNSPKQVGEILFEHLEIQSDRSKKTRTGQFRTDESELKKIRNKHPVADKILEYRRIKKLLSTYIDSLPMLADQKTNKIHSSYNQAVVTTGRLSSSNPNLQNIPLHTTKDKVLRKIFVAEEGCSFLSADYSQIELRIMAHMSQDETMIQTFLDGVDIHVRTASKIYNVPEDEVTSVMRSKAKIANFGMIYGITTYGLSEKLGIYPHEAKVLLTEYFKSFPRVKEYIKEEVIKARDAGYVETIMKRRRYLPDINSANRVVRGYAERTAVNAPIQGSAADIIKVAMVSIHRRLREQNLGAKMIMQVHDELNFNVPNDELEIVKNIVVSEMEGAAKLSVPLKVDCSYGVNWAEAH